MRLVERAIAAINARDIEGYLACCTENVKLDTPMAAVGGVYEGIDGIRRFLTDVEDAAPDFRIELDGVEEVDSKRVIAFMRTSSTGRASGIRMAAPTTNVYDLIDGKISHIRIFFDRQQALKALGLEEWAMSQQNVEIVAAASKAFADGGLDAYAEFWHPDINWRAMEGAPDDVGEMQGTEAARRYIQDWLDMFEDLTNVAEEPLDVGGDRVVAVHHATGRARLSGIETELRYAAVYTLREGKIVRVREYSDREQALRAVGLAE